MAPDPIPFVTRVLAGFARDRKAATAVEYGLILALVVLALMVGLVALGGNTQLIWDGVRDKVVTATGPLK